jgi:hypothetical protein
MSTSVKKSLSSPKALQDCHLLILWTLPHIDQFPKVRRFSLGSRIEEGLIFVLERLVEATYSRARQPLLRDANLRLEVIRHLWRSAFELKALAMSSWQHGAELMIELGRQIGGWEKASAP